MLIGYARVPTGEQNLSLQRTALEAAGCERVFEDRGLSGAGPRRPALDEALAALGPGAVFVVWKLDRLGRSLPHLLALVERLKGQGAGFRSLTEAMDTTTSGWRADLPCHGGAGAVRAPPCRHAGRPGPGQAAGAPAEAQPQAAGACPRTPRGRDPAFPGRGRGALQHPPLHPLAGPEAGDRGRSSARRD